MLNHRKKSALLAAAILIALSACAPRHNILSQMAKQDEADNQKIIAQLKNRIYGLDIESISNSVSKVLSNINKSAKLLEEEIGVVESVQTGHAIMSKTQENRNAGQQVSGKSFTNTYVYKGKNHALRVTAHIRQLGLEQTEVNLTFARTVGENHARASLQLPPGYTQAIYDKLWSAIEKEL